MQVIAMAAKLEERRIERNALALLFKNVPLKVEVLDAPFAFQNQFPFKDSFDLPLGIIETAVSTFRSLKGSYFYKF